MHQTGRMFSARRRRHPNVRISPTAHYTGEVWRRNGLAPGDLGTTRGRLLYAGLLAPMSTYRAAGGPTMEQVLLRRHLALDAVLARAIEAGEVGGVLEVAAGLSPRGLRVLGRYAHLPLRYVEADLPGMAARKRRLLQRRGLERPDLTVVPCDAFASTGPLSLNEVARAHLDPAAGVAVVTEGLLNYFPRAATEDLWARIAGLLRRHNRGGGRSLYAADLHLRTDVEHGIMPRAFRRGVEIFTRGKVHLPYERASDAEAALRAAGFQGAWLGRPSQAAATHGLAALPADPALGTSAADERVHILVAR